MKIRISISRRLTFSFVLIAIATTLMSYFSYREARHNLVAFQNEVTVTAPSLNALKQMDMLIADVKIYIRSWIAEVANETPAKKKLNRIHQTDYPELKETLSRLNHSWPKNRQGLLLDIFDKVEAGLAQQQLIMKSLASVEYYQSDSLISIALANSDEGSEMMLNFKRAQTDIQDMIKEFTEESATQQVALLDSFAHFQAVAIFKVLGVLLFIALVAFAITRLVVVPLERMRQALSQLSKGQMPAEMLDERNDEIGDMGNSLNTLVRRLKENSEFALNIGEGVYDRDFAPLGREDILGNSLLMMRQNLMDAAREQERRKKEDEQRSWATQGLAKFGELLRQDTEDLEDLSYLVISELVRYLGANQGALFMVEGDKSQRNIELKAAYAYEKRKIIEKRFEVGVGVVGQTVLEGETIYMTEIPAEYIKITSGLGENAPRSLLVVPLKVNEDVLGVIEVASFYPLEEYQIDFVEKIGSTIASAFSSIKVNKNTARLLEESREISEQMAQQEEEMRQNMEEMQATQEEMEVRIREERHKQERLQTEYGAQVSRLQQKIEALEQALGQASTQLNEQQYVLDNSSIVIEFGTDGALLSTNALFARISGFTKKEMRTKMLFELLVSEEDGDQEVRAAWPEVLLGNAKEAMGYYSFKGKLRWLKGMFTPIFDAGGQVIKVIGLFSDLTRMKRKEKELSVYLAQAEKQVEQLRKELGECQKEIERLSAMLS